MPKIRISLTMQRLDRSLEQIRDTPWLWQQWLWDHYRCRVVAGTGSNSGYDLEFDSAYSAYLFVFQYS